MSTNKLIIMASFSTIITLIMIGMHFERESDTSSADLRAVITSVIYESQTSLHQCYLDALRAGKQGIEESVWCPRVDSDTNALNEFLGSLSLNDEDKAYVDEVLAPAEQLRKLYYIKSLTEPPVRQNETQYDL